MKTIKERANLAAWQIYEEIGLSKHSVDRVAEIIEEKVFEQKVIDEANPSDAVIMRILNAIGYEEESWIPIVRKNLEIMEE